MNNATDSQPLTQRIEAADPEARIAAHVNEARDARQALLDEDAESIDFAIMVTKSGAGR